MSRRGTYHIHITGQVQGVGFRPFVFRMATELGVVGTVSNGVDGVHILALAVAKEAQEFVRRIKRECPIQARIESLDVTLVDDRSFERFEIVESQSAGHRNTRISPDFSICKDCIADLQDERDGRFRYAFATCTNCGPRYSIFNGLPYDRMLTEMSHFVMCADCAAEYDDPMNRRFYSQTNSCPACGIQLSMLLDGKKPEGASQEQLLTQAVGRLSRGEIGAIKGIGGYLLVCDATNAKAIASLRQRKQRPDKPFAVMYPDLAAVREDFQCRREEIELLTSAAAPIVLLTPKEEMASGIDRPGVAPGLDTIGVMLPYAPLLWLLANAMKRPLVATSGNISGAPIVYKDEQAASNLSTFCDFVLGNDRPIAVPQDDSVVKYEHGTPVLIRRSRGYAPSFFGALPSGLRNGTLALGAHMKSSFSLVHEGHLYASQYLGNLESFDAQCQFKSVLEHMMNVLDFKVQRIVTDMHPQYFAHGYGKDLAADLGVELSFIQHHEAHFAAVLAENELLNSDAGVMGVIWDGTGHGRDGNVWGGEFLHWDGKHVGRTLHMELFPHLAGDNMASQPRLSALALLSAADRDLVRNKFSDQEWSFYTKLACAPALWTTSVGRLFDGVASLLGLLDHTTYEGQAAMYLEAAARSSASRQAKTYPFDAESEVLTTTQMMAAIADDMKEGVPTSEIAYRFHLTLVKMVNAAARRLGIRKVAFSGGVFQNTLLVSLIKAHLSEEFSLYFHQELSPNDEGISFGQIMLDHIASGHVECGGYKKALVYETS